MSVNIAHHSCPTSVGTPQDGDRKSPRLRFYGVALVAAFFAAVSVPAVSAFADDDPPGRVGRLAAMDGTVSFHTADQTTWGAATTNYPITTGNALWADNGSHASVQLDGNDINLGSQTELDIDRLDDQTFQASLPQGNVYLNLRGLNSGDQYQIATPRGTISINQPGQYEISSGDQTHPGTVTVLAGGAQVTGDNVNLSVGAGQSGVLSDNGQGGPVQATLAPAQQGQDDLIAWARSREPQAAPPQAAAAMTGTQDLGNYGNWSTSPDYGSVWYPQVAADWVPYRNGHWAWVAPWGWTWIDDAPWGFAPFHYGRWVQIGPRWAWAPRPIVVAAPVVPIYAPALVSFVGDIGGVGVGISIGGPSVGWVPLGPREVYYPPYRVSDRYRRNVNVTYVKNVNVINVHNTTVINNVTVNHFANHGAVTVVSRDTMLQSRRVSGSVEHVNEADLAKMRGFTGGRAPLQPTARTAGLTPHDAQHFGVSPQDIHDKSSAGPKIEQNNARNWDKFSPAAKNNNLRAADHQNGQPQNGTNNTHWANQGSHKPGSPVQQKQQLETHNNPQSKVQQQGQQQVNHNQSQQNKFNWSNNNQSRKPGAAVTQKNYNFQQNNKAAGNNGQAVIRSQEKQKQQLQHDNAQNNKSTNTQSQQVQSQLKAQNQQQEQRVHQQQQQRQSQLNAERQRQNQQRQNQQRENNQRQQFDAQRQQTQHQTERANQSGSKRQSQQQQDQLVQPK